jgi:hypothetical protein
VKVQVAVEPFSVERVPAPRWTNWGGRGRDAGGSLLFSAPLELPLPLAAGEGIVFARALDARDNELGRDAAFISIRASALEEESTQPDRAGMEAAVAAAGSGRVRGVARAELAGLVADLAPRMKPVVRTRRARAPLLPPLAAMFVLAAALCLEIWWRRRGPALTS